MVEWLFRTSSASEIPSACSFGECKFRGFEGSAEQRYHFVLRGNAQGPPQVTKDLEFAKNRCGIRDTSQVFATHVEEVPTNTVFTGAAVVLISNVEDVQCLLGRWLHSRHFRCQSLMRETFRVRVCERVDPGFLITV